MSNAAEPFRLDRHDSGSVVLWLEPSEGPAGGVVVLDLPLIQRLEATLNSVPADATGFILASASERVFVAGADLKAIQSLSDDELAGYLAYASRVFGMICQLPCWTAAAIGGAALGGGLELAMHCDGLIGSPGPKGSYPVGLPEAGLSICPGWGGTNLLPARIDGATAISMTSEGRTMAYEEASSLGLFDAVADSREALIDAAAAWLEQARSTGAGLVVGGGSPRRDGEPMRWIGRPANKSRALAAYTQVRDDLPMTPQTDAVFEAIEAGLERGWKAALETEQRHLVHLRSTPEGKQAIEAFFARSAAKK